MKTRTSYLTIIVLICLSGSNIVAQPLANRTDYLGFPKPGSRPEVFAPDFISTDYAEFAGTFSPDFQEYYFSRRGPFQNGIAQVMVTYKTQDGWSEPIRAPFSTNYYEFEPFITPDGKRLYYGSRRSPDGILPPGQMHQWYLDKLSGMWTGPELLGDPFFDIMVMYPCTTLDSTLYFTGIDGIYYSECDNGIYQEPVKLGPEINFLPMTAHSYVAPDNSYIIFDGQARGEGLSDLFISYRKGNTAWCKGKYMGVIVNAGESQAIASVSPDGECLFFTRDQDIYWMDASIIHDLRLIPALTCSRDSGYVPLLVQFKLDLSTVPDSITAVEWDFNNDGITDSYDFEPEFTYLEEGLYSISLKVFCSSDSAGWTWEDRISVEDSSGYGMYDHIIPDWKHRLDQNFPNPFTNETSICYSLNKDADVRLDVFDLLGNKVDNLVNEFQYKGSYQCLFDSERLASGLFVYSLSTHDQQYTRLMIKK